MTNFEWIKSMEPFEMSHFLSNIQYDSDEPTAEQVAIWLYDDVLLTWDDIFYRAINKGFGSDELTAKDEARYQLAELIKEEAGYDIESCECPEDEIDEYLGDRKVPVFFDERGNIIQS